MRVEMLDICLMKTLNRMLKRFRKCENSNNNQIAFLNNVAKIIEKDRLEIRVYQQPRTKRFRA